jgi:hypothetical protein
MALALISPLALFMGMICPLGVRRLTATGHQDLVPWMWGINGICGVIVGLREPIDPATGQPQVDDKNPNPALRTRPVIGLSLFIGMRPSAPGKWSGQIYNADDGGTYVSYVTFSGADALRVEGCVGMICGGETWTRVGH